MSLQYGPPFDELVLRAISRKGTGESTSLIEILASVDGFQKVVLSHEELAGALSRLAASGKIREVESRRFSLTEVDEPTVLSSYTPEDHESVCKAYTKSFLDMYRKMRK